MGGGRRFSRPSARHRKWFASRGRCKCLPAGAGAGVVAGASAPHSCSCSCFCSHRHTPQITPSVSPPVYPSACRMTAVAAATTLYLHSRLSLESASGPDCACSNARMVVQRGGDPSTSTDPSLWQRWWALGRLSASFFMHERPRKPLCLLATASFAFFFSFWSSQLHWTKPS